MDQRLITETCSLQYCCSWFKNPKWGLSERRVKVYMLQIYCFRRLPKCAFISLTMSAECTSYYSAENVFVNAFTCPKPEGAVNAIFCCGFNDIKYCCDDPNSFFPYEYGYMWWLSVGALIGLSIAAVVLLTFIITVCVLCYLFIATKPNRPDNGLPLEAAGFEPSLAEGPSNCGASSGPQGFRKHFLSRKLDCDNHPTEPERLFQRCFMGAVPTVNVEGP